MKAIDLGWGLSTYVREGLGVDHDGIVQPRMSPERRSHSCPSWPSSPARTSLKYHKVFEVGGLAILEQPSRLNHICYRDDGWTVVDVWEDEASIAAFREVIGPATHQAWRDASPPSTLLEGTIAQDGTRTTY